MHDFYHAGYQTAKISMTFIGAVSHDLPGTCVHTELCKLLVVVICSSTKLVLCIELDVLGLMLGNVKLYVYPSSVLVIFVFVLYFSL